jgi:hypothetical protein
VRQHDSSIDTSLSGVDQQPRVARKATKKKGTLVWQWNQAKRDSGSIKNYRKDRKIFVVAKNLFSNLYVSPFASEPTVALHLAAVPTASASLAPVTSVVQVVMQIGRLQAAVFP